MKGKLFYILILCLGGMFFFSTTEAGSNVSPKGTKSYVIIKASNTNPQKQPAGDSPFIRFHHGIDESNFLITSPSESIIPLKPVNDSPEKFAGIIEYVSSLSYILPVTRVFLYATPLRSPPIFC